MLSAELSTQDVTRATCVVDVHYIVHWTIDVEKAITIFLFLAHIRKNYPFVLTNFKWQRDNYQLAFMQCHNESQIHNENA